jgi:hypothetical protein
MLETYSRRAQEGIDLGQLFTVGRGNGGSARLAGCAAVTAARIGLLVAPNRYEPLSNWAKTGGKDPFPLGAKYGFLCAPGTQMVPA